MTSCAKAHVPDEKQSACVSYFFADDESRIDNLLKHPRKNLADVLKAMDFIKRILEKSIFGIVKVEIPDSLRGERFIEMQKGVDSALGFPVGSG